MLKELKNIQVEADRVVTVGDEHVKRKKLNDADREATNHVVDTDHVAN